MMPAKLALLMMPVLLAACAVGPTLDQRLATYIGRSEGELVSELGVPVRSYDTDGRRFLQFEQYSMVAVAQPEPFGYYGRYRPWMAPPTYAQLRCNLTFAIREHRVESFSLNGQGC